MSIWKSEMKFMIDGDYHKELRQKHDGVSLLNTFSEIVAKKLQILKRKYPVANVLTKIFSHEILLRDIWNIIIFPWKISLNAVNFIRKTAKKKQISFLWRILDPNWVHLMIEKRAKEVQKFYFKFLRSNWIKFQIACIILMGFFSAIFQIRFSWKWWKFLLVISTILSSNVEAYKK